jgi:hypothetical protein
MGSEDLWWNVCTITDLQLCSLYVGYCIVHCLIITCFISFAFCYVIITCFRSFIICFVCFLVL